MTRRPTTPFRLVLLLSLSLAVPAAASGQSLNMVKLGHLQNYPFHSDIWGYHAPDGTELAIVGTFNGTTIIDATDPATPVEIAFFPGPSSTWRDMKTYRNYAYIVNETGDGLQILDLSTPLAPTLAASDSTFFSTAHNLYADTTAAKLYVCGSDAPGMLILDLSDPLNPTLAANFSTLYVHDVYAANGLAYAAAIFDGVLATLDVSALPAVPILDTAITADAFCHNTWLDAGGNFCLTTDEVSGGHVQIFDVNDPTAIFPVSEWKNPADSASIVHNAIVSGTFAYVSWYRTGIQVLDVSDPYFPQRVGTFDTFAGSGNGFDGDWGVYPFQPSGTIYVSDIDTGFYTLSFDPNFGIVNGTVRDAATAVPLEGATVKVPPRLKSVQTAPSGFYKLDLIPGVHSVVYERFAYAPDTIDVAVLRDSVSVVDVNLIPLPAGSLTGFVGALGAYAPTAGAELRIVGTPLVAVADSAGHYEFPSVPAGSYTVATDVFGFAPVSVPVAIVLGVETRLDLSLTPAAWVEDFENPSGWTAGVAGDNAVTGMWELADPVGTGNGTVQPENDHTVDPGVLCFVTGASGGGIGANDVDGGITTLLSPVLDLSGVQNPVLRYHRWYVNDAGANPGTDLFTGEVSIDGGATWATLDSITDSRAFWEPMTFPLAPAAQTRLRFIARDLGGGSIVEAGLDDLEILGDNTTVAVPDSQGGGVAAFFAAPNPLQGATTIHFETAGRERVHLDVFDLRGRRVRTLLDSVLPAGGHEAAWDGRDASGRDAASGVYFLRLVAGERHAHRKIVLSR